MTAEEYSKQKEKEAYCGTEFCTSEIAKSFNDGMEEMKQQLMENAVEAVIHPYDGEIWVDKDLLSIYNDLQRVKLIIIEEE